MNFPNRGKWIKEAEDKLAARDTMTDPEYIKQGEEVFTYKESEELEDVPSDEEFEDEYLDEDDDCGELLVDDDLDVVEEEVEPMDEVRYIDPTNIDKYDPSEIEEVTKADGSKAYKRKNDVTVKSVEKTVSPKLFSAKNRDFSKYSKGQEKFVADSFSKDAIGDINKEDLTKRVKELYDAGLSFDAVTANLDKDDIDNMYSIMDGFPGVYPDAARNRENLAYFMLKAI